MKAIAYLLSGVLATPGVLLAYYFWTVKEAISQGNLPKLLFFLLVHWVRMLEWGIWLILALVLVWVTMAFLPRYRWIGAVGMGLLALASLVEIFAVTGPPRSLDDLSFPALSVLALAVNIWLVCDGAPVLAWGN